MKPLFRPSFVGYSLLMACASNNQASQNPDAAKYDNYYSEKPGQSTGDGTTVDGSGQKQPKYETTATRTAKVPGKLVAKRPAVTGPKPRTKPAAKRPGSGVALQGFLPSAAAPGSLIELFGTDLDQPGIAVAIGNIPQKVVKAENDRLVIQVAAKSGPITLTRQQATRKSKAQNVPFASSKTTFTALKPDKMFGQPRKHADNGLVGLVYKIDPGTKEVPDFSKFGQPDAVIAVDNLDIASGTSKQGLGTIKENFAIHFKGSLNVVDGGDYNLCLGAGDGAQLYLEEGLVLDNDGSHDTEEVCDDVFIEAGEYALDLLYYQGTGELGLQLSWAKADGNKVAVPAEVFFPPEDRVNLVVP